MSIGINGNSSYEQAKLRQEAASRAKEKAETAKAEAENKVSSASIQAETNAVEAENAANQASKEANDVTVVSEKLNTANLAVNSAQQAYNNVLNQLSQAQASGNDDNIATAQATVSSAYTKLQEAIRNANQIQQELEKETQEAEEAAKNAELKQQAADEALLELNIAETELSQAEAEYNAAIAELDAANAALEEAENAAKTEESKATNNTSSIEEPSHLSQEEIDELVKNGATYITSQEEFLKIFQGEDFDPNGNYILGCDIDLKNIDWKPVGNEQDPFSGIFNGNGYSINNLTINLDESNAENVGFFGITANAEIKNITFNNASVITPDDYINGSSAVGIVVGNAMGTVFDNIDISGTVQGYESVGALAGVINDAPTYITSDGKTFEIRNSEISNVTTSVDASGKYYVGGLIGYVEDTATYEGVALSDLKITNCSTSGNIIFDDESAGGFIGEAGKTIITINNSTSSVNIDWNNTENDGDISFLMETGRAGGFIGCANGTYIAVCNSDYNGNLNVDGDFNGDVYGWYMNGAHITTYDLPGGLPIDDILNIDGIDSLTPVTNSETGVSQYQVTVSTLTGLDKMVSMIQANPELADIIVFNVNFDFETMDGMYDSSIYAQYGIVQEIYQDDDGNIHNDVYIDNEIDPETTFHYSNGGYSQVEATVLNLSKTMVSGLYKNDSNEYVVITDDGSKTVNLQFNYDNQITDVTKRLQSDEEVYREYVMSLVKYYQNKMMAALKAIFGIEEEKNPPTINKAEYKKLQKMKEAGMELTKEQEYAIALYEVDFKVSNIVSNVTHNSGCGMGGDASFLSEDTAIQMYDEAGRPLFTTLAGDQLRQRMDENGELMTDDDGNPIFEYYDGKDYVGIQEVFAQRGYPVTDDDGNFLYTDKEGNTITKTVDEEGNSIFTNADGTIFEENEEELTQQLEPCNITEEFKNLEEEMQDIVSDLEAGNYPLSEDVNSNSETTSAETNTSDTVITNPEIPGNTEDIKEVIEELEE